MNFHSFAFAISLLCTATAASAASFDCNKAATPTEKAICTDAGLSKLDDELGKLYATARSSDKGKAQFVRDSQISWAKSEQQQCNRDIACITSKHNERIAFLAALNTPDDAPYNMAATASDDASDALRTDFNLASSSKHLRFALHLYKACDQYCGPARITITSRDNPHLKQAIYLEYIEVLTADDLVQDERSGKQKSKSDEYAGIIQIGDFNFDGREDFAIRIGHEGAYNNANYDYYLNHGDKFVFNADLTEFRLEAIDFQIDPVKREIIKWERGGCCQSQTTHYHMVGDQPVEFEHDIVEASIADLDHPHEYTDRFIDGQWKVIKSKGRVPHDNCEKTLEDVLEANVDQHNELYSACRPLPNEPHTGIAAATFTVLDRQIGLDLFYVNMDSGAILARRHVTDAYIEPGDSKLNAEALLIDTARYQIASDTRAIGIRTRFRQEGDSGSITLLTLLYRDGPKIVPVLDKLATDFTNKENRITRTISIGKETSHGYADLIVKEVVQKKIGEAIVSTQETTLHYDGKRYVLPEELARLTW